MKHVPLVPLLSVVFAVIIPSCERGEAPAKASVHVESIEIRVRPLPPGDAAPPADAPNSCEAPSPVLAEYDPGPVELPGPAVMPPRSRAAMQCTESSESSEAT